MWQHWRVYLAVWLLRRGTISMEDRNLLTAAMVDRLGATPIRDIIAVNGNGEVLVNGVLLDYEQAVRMREGAKAALSNKTLSLVWDQVRYTSFVGGVSTGDSPESILFYRTAIWNGEQERTWLRLLAGEETQ